MGKRKVQTPKLNNKETLVAFCMTLTENKAKEAYVILQEHFGLSRRKILKFDSNGVESKSGVVRLTQLQVNKLLERYGELTFKRICNELDRYINYLKDNKDEPRFRTQYNRYISSTHYQAINNWVITKVEKLYPNSTVASEPKQEGLDFYSISTISEAIEYVKSIPIPLRINNPEIEYLVTQYPKLLEEVSNDR